MNMTKRRHYNSSSCNGYGQTAGDRVSLGLRAPACAYCVHTHVIVMNCCDCVSVYQTIIISNISYVYTVMIFFFFFVNSSTTERTVYRSCYDSVLAEHKYFVLYRIHYNTVKNLEYSISRVVRSSLRLRHQEFRNFLHY